jgi:predicted nucleic acid-binding protein
LVILVDTGPLVALNDPRDTQRAAVRSALAQVTDRLVVPLPVLGEVAYLLDSRTHAALQAGFLLDLASGRFDFESPLPSDYARASALVMQYADFPLGIVDSLIAAMAERLNVTTLFTLDRRHFGAIRPVHCEAFALVP